MYIKEYRICMPLSVEEYHVGQLYMIAKHSHEQSGHGEGVAVIKNEPCEHPVHGHGQFTEKHIYLSSRLPGWMASWVPNFFHVTEKAWNFYPHTITGLYPRAYNQCTFLPRFSITIDTRYEDNNGSSDNVINLSDEELSQREVDFVDIVNDALAEKHYKPEEDLTLFKSQKTGRGPLDANWKETSTPIMCSYKLVRVKFEVFGLQTRVESSVHNAIREILLLGHRQAVAWIDEWFGMTMDDIRRYESRMQDETNKKVGASTSETETASAAAGTAAAADGVASLDQFPFTPTNTPIDKAAPVQFFNDDRST